MRKITNWRNTFWHRLLVLFLFMAFSGMSWGQAILTETFNYATPAYIGGNGAAGTSSNGWTTHSVTTGQTTTINVLDGSLNYTGLASSVGNKILLPGTNTTVSRDINAPFTTVSTTLYFSALINLVDNTQINTTGDYFLSYGSTAGSAAGSLGARLGAKSVNTGANFRFVIQNTSGGTPTWTDNGSDLVFGTTYLVVVKYDRSASPTAATLWVNPITLGSTEPSGSVSNNSGTSAVSALASICLRNSATTPKVEIDEIRVGTTFASVTPIPDIIPPVWTATYPKAANITPTAADLLVNADEAGTAYYVVLTNGAIAPTSAEVKAGTASGGGAAIAAGNKSIVAASTEYIANLSGLTATTQYDIYVVAQDDEGTPNIQATPTLVEITTLTPDITAPIWTVTYPKTSAVANTDFNLLVNLDEIGKAYYVVLANGSVVPSVAEVKGATAAGLVKSGSVNVTGAATEFAANVSGLNPATIYDVYAVAEDDETVPNVQASIAAIADVTTTNILSEPTAQATGLTAVANNQTTVTLSWTDATAAQVPEGYLILVNTTGTFTNPVDGTAQADDLDLSDGTSVVNIAQGVQTKQWINAVAGTTYNFKVYSFTNSGAAINYLLTSPPTATASTPKLVLNPLGASTYYAGDTVNLSWISANIANLKVEMYIPSATAWSQVTSTIAADGLETITIPATSAYGTTYKFRLSDASNALVNAESAAFTVKAVTNNLVDLLTMPANAIVKYIGKATVTYTRTSRNQKYIQDATGAVLIDDATTAPGFITGTYAIGDGITNIEGKIVLYNGLVELVPLATTGATATGNPVITPEIRTIASLVHADQCKLVKIVNYSFDPAGAQYVISNLFVSSKNYDVSGVALAGFAFRTAFSEANYIGLTIPVTPITTVGLVGQFNTQMQITARNLADIKSAVATVSSVAYVVGATTITNVPYSTDLATFKSNLTAALGAAFNVFDADGTTPATILDDTKKVIVTAEDGITKNTYSITRNAVLTEKAITAFSILGVNGVFADPKISIEVPNSTDLTTLVATFTLSAGAKAEVGTTLQASGVTVNNFTNPVVYKVTAEDGTTKNWTVTVTKSVVLKTGKDILAYSVAGVNATIDAGLHTVKATLPYGTNLTALVATFTLSDVATAKVGTTPQVSEVTANDFSAPVTYTVTAEDASTLDWVVTLTLALPSTDASVSSTVYTVSASEITNIPYGTPLVTFKSNITPAAHATFEVYHSDGTTVATDLATGYKVIGTAQDGSTTKVYTITIDAAPASDLFISEYVEGSSNNKAFEIFNPGTIAVDLSAYSVKASNNGVGFGMVASTPPAADNRYVLTFAAGTMINPGDVYVVYNTQATADNGIAAAGDLGLTYSATVNDPVNLGANVAAFNGNDALGLFKNGVLIDVFGIELSATNFDVAGVVGAALDHTIIRKSRVRAGNTNWSISAGIDASTSEWIVDAKDVFTYLGSHTMDPANDTEAPVATITPSNGAVDVLATVNPTIVFNEMVYKAADGAAFTANEDVTSLIEFYETATPANTVTFVATISGANISIVPAGNLKNLVQYTLALKAAVVEDVAGNENIAAQTSFTTIVSTVATLQDLKVDGTTIAGFNSSIVDYTVELPFGTVNVPVLSGTATDANATVKVIQSATLPCNDTVLVTAQDGETQISYVVHFTLGEEPTYTVTFIVTDESSAIVEFAKVDFNSTSVVTDDLGKAVFTNVYAVTDAPFTVSKGVNLYEAYSSTVTVSNSDVTVDVVLILVGVTDNNSLVSSLYPNPTNGKVFLTLNSEVKSAQVTVTDLTGKVIISREWSSLESILDLSGNKQGIYFIKITSVNDTFTGRIVLN